MLHSRVPLLAGRSFPRHALGGVGGSLFGHGMKSVKYAVHPPYCTYSHTSSPTQEPPSVAVQLFGTVTDGVVDISTTSPCLV